MKIKLFYDDEYIEGKDDFSCMEVTADNWIDFWLKWVNPTEFIMCDSIDSEKTVYLRKDRVIQIIGDDNDEFWRITKINFAMGRW